MPSRQTKDQHRFNEAWKTYLSAIELSKKALRTAIQHPSAESKAADRQAHANENAARKEYRKAAKKLRSHIEERPIRPTE
jgi:hypothetical protein